MDKKIIAIIASVLVIGFVVIFRSQIGRLVTFQQGGEQQNFSESPLPSLSTAPSESEVPGISRTPSPVSSQMPIYSGRPQDELRPDPEEVKLYSESQKQDIYRALQNFGKTVKENPDLFNLWIQLGLLKKTIGDYEGARDAWEYASIIRPLNDISFANLGQLYWRYLHLYAQAETNFKTAIKNNPHDSGTYGSLSDLYFYSMKDKAALADDVLLQGLAANPESINLPKALARLYERRGEYASAIEWWQKVLAQDPKDTSVAAVIDALKKKLGQ